MDSRSHWEKIYGEKAPNAVSWYRPHLETSLSLIERVASTDSAIIDVGGGESTLVDDLLSHGYENVTVLSQKHNSRFFLTCLSAGCESAADGVATNCVRCAPDFIPETPSPFPLRTNSCTYS
jgi:hypothetical protein